jgi:hypothetical protein
MNRGLRAPFRRPALIASGCATAIFARVYGLRAADQSAANPAPVFQQYCVGCHNNKLATAGISFEKLIDAPSVAENYQAWERVSAMLDQKRMPPAGMPQPSDQQRSRAVGLDCRSARRALGRKSAAVRPPQSFAGPPVGPAGVCGSSRDRRAGCDRREFRTGRVGSPVRGTVDSDNWNVLDCPWSHRRFLLPAFRLCRGPASKDHCCAPELFRRGSDFELIEWITTSGAGPPCRYLASGVNL